MTAAFARPGRRALLLVAAGAGALPACTSGPPPRHIDPAVSAALRRVLVLPPGFAQGYVGPVQGVQAAGAMPPPTGTSGADVAGALVAALIVGAMVGAMQRRAKRRDAWVGPALQGLRKEGEAVYLRSAAAALGAAGYEPLTVPLDAGAAWDAALVTTIEAWHVTLNPLVGPQTVNLRVQARLLRRADEAELMRVTLVNYPPLGDPSLVRLAGAPFEVGAEADPELAGPRLRATMLDLLARAAEAVVGYLR